MAKGGTAEIVSFKREGMPPALSHSARAALDASEIGPVIHLVTPRIKNPDVPIEVRPWGGEVIKHWQKQHPSLPSQHSGGVPSPLEQEAIAWREFAATTALTRRFNAEAAGLAHAPDGQERQERSLADLFESEERVEGKAALSRAREIAPRWCTLYAMADVRAQAWQAQFRFDWLLLFTLGFGALIFFELKAHLFHGAVWLLFGYGVFLFALAGWLTYARRSQHQQRFLDYRALAEALRVAVFWKLAGVDASSTGSKGASFLPIAMHVFTSIADAYPIKQPSELAWVKLCLRTLELLDSAYKAPAASLPVIDEQSYGWARELWIGGQLSYFTNKSHAHHRSAELRERWSLGFLLIAPVLAAGLLWFYYFGGGAIAESPWHHGGTPHHALVFLIGILSGGAAALAGHTEQLALKAQARQYDRMRALFERAYMVLPGKFADITPPLAQAILVEIGSEAMKENAEWVAIYRQRPIRAPQG
jgi:hypothetical protein